MLFYAVCLPPFSFMRCPNIYVCFRFPRVTPCGCGYYRVYLPSRCQCVCCMCVWPHALPVYVVHSPSRCRFVSGHRLPVCPRPSTRTSVCAGRRLKLTSVAQYTSDRACVRSWSHALTHWYYTYALVPYCSLCDTPAFFRNALYMHCIFTAFHTL